MPDANPKSKKHGWGSLFAILFSIVQTFTHQQIEGIEMSMRTVQMAEKLEKLKAQYEKSLALDRVRERKKMHHEAVSLGMWILGNEPDTAIRIRSMIRIGSSNKSA